MSSEFRVLKSLEWCTELPSINCSRKSPVFFLKSNRCFLRFAFEKRHLPNLKSDIWCYCLQNELENQDTAWEPCNLQLQVGFKKEKILSLRTKNLRMTKGKEEVWCISHDCLLAKLPYDYIDGNFMKFLLSFDVGSEDVLNNSKKVDDKCFQTGSYLNTDVSVESSFEDYSKLLCTGQNQDVVIKCGGFTIKAHKIILCARSGMFKAMLQSSTPKRRTAVLEIQNIDVSCVRDFITYLYTGRMPSLTFQKARMLYEAGYEYDVKSLMDRCSEYLQDTLTQENAFEYFILAEAYSDAKLKDRFVSYILEEKIYLQDDIWVPFCESYPRTACAVYRLSHKIVGECKKLKIFHC